MYPTKTIIQSALAVMTLAMTGCAPSSPSESADGTKTVSVSLPVIGWFAERIGGPAVRVNVMIPQSADHDTYTPRPSQMKSLSESEAYIALGPLEFEQTWRERLTSAAPELKWLELSAGIETMAGHEEHEQTDPHYWTSPRQAKTLAANMATILKTLVPEASAQIDSARDVVLAEIAERDSCLSRIVRITPNKSFMIYHPALSYMSRDYGLRQIAIEQDGVAPTAKTYAQMTQTAKEAGVSVVFVQKGYDAGRAESAAKELGATIISISPEGADWTGTMDTIIAGLKE